MRNGHKKFDEVSAFCCTGSNRFEVARGARLQGQGVVLLTPYCSPAVNGLELRCQNATNPALQSQAGFLAQFGGNKCKFRLLSRDVPKEFERMRHRLIVERDGVVIAADEWINLGKPAVWILRGEHVAQTAQKRFAPGTGANCIAFCFIDSCQKIQLENRGIVVKGAIRPRIDLLGVLRRRLRVADALLPPASL